MRINSTHASFYFGELVGWLFHDVGSSGRTVKWNVTVINELWNIMDAQ
jgi:hypothetical protein